MSHIIIPARLDSRRVFQKNVRNFCGRTLLEIAIQKALDVKLFDKIVVNSPDAEILQIAKKMNVDVYNRPKWLGTAHSTNNDFIKDYLHSYNISSKYIYMLNTTSPLLSIESMTKFTNFVESNDYDTVLSVVKEKSPFLMNNQPVNFCYDHHTPSEFLSPLRKVVWAITAWNKFNFNQECGVYAGEVGCFELPKKESIDIDLEEDWELAEILYKKEYGVCKSWTGLDAEFGGE